MKGNLTGVWLDLEWATLRSSAALASHWSSFQIPLAIAILIGGQRKLGGRCKLGVEALEAEVQELPWELSGFSELAGLLGLSGL